MKRIFFLCMLLALCLMICGCTSRQLEEQLLVIILGIDETEEGHIRITVKVPSNSDSTSSSSGGKEGKGGDASTGGEQKGYLLLEATGRKFTDAINLLHATTPRTLNFSQTREVVIGEKAAQSDDFIMLIHSIYSLPRMRAQAALVICKDEAHAFAAEQRPFVGMRLSRYVETTLSNYAGKGFVPTTTLGDGLRDLGYGFQDPLLIYAAVNQFDHIQTTTADNILDAVPGSLARKSVNPIEFFGAAATDGISVSGMLTGYEMALLHLIDGDVQSLSIQTQDDNSIPIFARAPATLTVDLDRHPAVLQVILQCEARYAAGFEPQAEDLERRLAQDIQKTIQHLQHLRCDGIGFGNIAIRNFITVDAWEALHWREVYCSAQVEVQVSVQLRDN